MDFAILLVRRFFQHKSGWIIAVALALLILVGLIMLSEPITMAPTSHGGS